MDVTAPRPTGPLSGWREAGRRLVPPSRSLPVPGADDRRVWDERHLDGPTLRQLTARARQDALTPWPAPRARDYARYFRDGDRDGYEQLVFARQARLSRAAVLAAVRPDPDRLDEVADGVLLLCEQSSWCWPAHDDTFTRHGAVLPTVTDPYLDLGAGEVAGQLAWLDHLLGSRLDERVPGLRARIRLEVDRRVLTPFRTRRDWHWLGDVHNWNPWIHGNVLVAALRLADDDPARRAGLVDLVVAGLDRYAASLPADGAIDEGYAYWWHGACRLLEAMDLLRHATGGTLDDTPLRALRPAVAFPHRMHLGGPWYLNHADGPARPSPAQPWDALHRAARHAGDDAAVAHAAAHRRPADAVASEEQGLGRLLRALTDRAWVSASPAVSPLPRDVWLASTQVLLARPRSGSRAGLTLAAKGGHNGEHHNHNDVGSVVVAVGGVPVLVDPGRPTYTAQTFGPGRYDLWPMQSCWHNTPTIRGATQAPGHRYAARDVSAVVDDTGSALHLDLAAAYPRNDIRRWERTARLDRATGTVTVRDSWQLDPGGRDGQLGPRGGDGQLGPRGGDGQLGPGGGDGPTHVHLVVAGSVRTGPGRAEIEALDGAGVVIVTWEPAGAPCTTTVRDLDDPMLREVWGDRLTRLDIDVTALGPTGTLHLSMKEQR